MRQVLLHNLGRRDYASTWDYQEALFKETVEIKFGNRRLPEGEQTPTRDHLLLVEHPPVYTLGKSGTEDHLLTPEADLDALGATYFKVNRGGDITFHGPGQVVGYPILDLDHYYTDIHRYLRELEEVIILTLKDYGLEGDRSKGETGVWLEPNGARPRKICAMGIRASRWVTMHGFALNVNTDLNYFNHIVPCGIQGKAVTSLQAELGREIPLEEVQQRILKHFQEVFRVEVLDAGAFSG